jgi:N-acetylmuramoyl-L-alanine amidase
MSLLCVGARNIKENVTFSEVKILDNGQPRKINVSTLTRGFDTYYHLKGICTAFDISFAYVPAKKRVLMNKGVNSMRLTVGGEPKLKEFSVYYDKKYYLSAGGLNHVFAGLMKGTVATDKKSKMLMINYTAALKPKKAIKIKPGFEIKNNNIRTIALLKGEKFKVKRIILDPGHGGKDPGAVGKNRLQEKEVTLDIALKTAELIRTKLRKEVILTRTTDEYVSLQERTAIADKHNGDLFVSIHINANIDREAEGTEVYIYDVAASDKKSGLIALRENFEFPGTGGIKSILGELGSTSNDNLSIMLAGNILDNIVNYVDVESRNKNMILRAPFYVLAHSSVPAVLLEIAFITNKDEEKKLREGDFRNSVAKAICFGLEDFIGATENPEKEELAPAADIQTKEHKKEGAEEE